MKARDTDSRAIIDKILLASTLLSYPYYSRVKCKLLEIPNQIERLFRLKRLEADMTVDREYRRAATKLLEELTNG